MIDRLHQLAGDGEDFAFETTLASRSFAPWIEKLKIHGYRFHLVFLTLPSPELAVERVAERVRLGGHNVPVETIRRRYFAGIRNFFDLFQPLADSWRIYDNSVTEPSLIASGQCRNVEFTANMPAWNRLLEIYNDHK